ncbi:FtsW/RodA/SpoVE family cell cycle protein, partial [Candidatus Parcubacteria bacterium]|nr:FtsW/RodA/SpoVE family cell cycle protein [Candidatus Parcubacteria bacterium]
MATRTRTSDYTLLTYFVVLILFGLLVLSSAGVSVGIERFQDPYFFIKRQLLLGLLPGVILFLIAAKIDYHVWKKYALPIFIAGLILLILPFIPGIGSTHGTGARSWIVLGGNSFQPAEAIKLGMIIFMAAFLSNMGKQIYDL